MRIQLLCICFTTKRCACLLWCMFDVLESEMDAHAQHMQNMRAHEERMQQHHALIQQQHGHVHNNNHQQAQARISSSSSQAQQHEIQSHHQAHAPSTSHSSHSHSTSSSSSSSNGNGVHRSHHHQTTTVNGAREELEYASDSTQGNATRTCTHTYASIPAHSITSHTRILHSNVRVSVHVGEMMAYRRVLEDQAKGAEIMKMKRNDGEQVV